MPVVLASFHTAGWRYDHYCRYLAGFRDTLKDKTDSKAAPDNIFQNFGSGSGAHVTVCATEKTTAVS